MTPNQIRDALDAMKAKIGPHAYVAVSISTDRKTALHGTIYPDGIIGVHSAIHFVGDTFEEVLTEMADTWAAHAMKFHRETVRKMALKIIDLAHAHGFVDAAALNKDFAPSLVAELGQSACELAADMTNGGPFTIAEAVKAAA